MSAHAVFALVDPCSSDWRTDAARVAAQLGPRATLVLRPSAPPPARTWLNWVAEARDAIDGTGARVIVSERADVARVTGVGLQLPERGVDVASARRWLGPEAPLGASRHDVRGAVRAAHEGADWVMVAPVFPTPSKPGHPGLGLAGLTEVIQAVRGAGYTTPIIALGGIGAAVLADVLATGVAGVAGIRGVAQGALG